MEVLRSSAESWVATVVPFRLGGVLNDRLQGSRRARGCLWWYCTVGQFKRRHLELSTNNACANFQNKNPSFAPGCSFSPTTSGISRRISRRNTALKQQHGHCQKPLRGRCQTGQCVAHQLRVSLGRMWCRKDVYLTSFAVSTL